MPTYKVHMILERETKGALRYQEAQDISDQDSDTPPEWVPLTIANGALVGNIYLRKDRLVPGAVLKHLDVMIEATP